MTNGTSKQHRSNNKLYGWLRRRLSEQMTGRVVSDATRAKLSARLIGNKSMAGKTHSAKTKQKMSAIAKGRVFSEEHRAALSAAKRGKALPPRSAEWRANQRAGILRAVASRDDSFRQTSAYKTLQAERMRQVWERRRLGLSPLPISMTKGE